MNNSYLITILQKNYEDKSEINYIFNFKASDKLSKKFLCHYS